MKTEGKTKGQTDIKLTKEQGKGKLYQEKLITNSEQTKTKTLLKVRKVEESKVEGGDLEIWWHE